MTETTSEKRHEVIAAILTDNRIPAIKLYREAIGYSLQQAKETTEPLADEILTKSKGTGYAPSVFATLFLLTLIVWQL